MQIAIHEIRQVQFNLGVTGRRGGDPDRELIDLLEMINALTR